MKIEVTIATIGLLLFSTTPGVAQKKELTDAIADSDYVHEFPVLEIEHDTRVIIDRYHNTIYREEGFATGAHVMLDIFERDGFDVRYTQKRLNKSLRGADMLIIHGLPNEEVELPSGEIFWRSPLSDDEVNAVVRFVDNGGGLFLTLSHFPGGSGAKPLLEAFAVQFRDGYIWHESAPSYTNPDGRCSHFFGMSPEAGLVKSEHPALKNALSVERVDYHCGAAMFRQPEDVVLAFPHGTGNFFKGTGDSINGDSFVETSDFYAGLIGFDYGKGRVVIAADQGMFRDFIFTFDGDDEVYVTITGPENDNANLFINLMRWLSPKLRDSKASN